MAGWNCCAIGKANVNAADMGIASAQYEEQKAQSFYLYCPAIPSSPLHSGNVFYSVIGERAAKILCRLFEKEYSSEAEKLYFSAKSAAEVEIEEQILLDEAVDHLYIYDDPDPGVYEVPPSKTIMTLAQYAQRA